MCIEDADQRDSLLQTLNSSVSTLSFPPMTPIKQALYAAGWVIYCTKKSKDWGQTRDHSKI